MRVRVRVRARVRVRVRVRVGVGVGEASAAFAPSLTRGCEAVSACSVSAGTTCGSVAASCLGAQ